MYISIGLYKSLKIYNRLVTACIAKAATGVKCLCSTSEKRHVFVFVRLSPSFFVCVRRNKQGNLAFRTIRVEDTHLTLAAILYFYRGEQLCKKICGYRHTRNILPRFRSCRIYNSLFRTTNNLVLSI